MAVCFAKVLYYMVSKDAGKSPGLDQWFPSCGAYAIMIDELFQILRKKKSHVFSLRTCCVLYAKIPGQGGNCFSVLSRKLEQFLSHIVPSQHSSRSLCHHGSSWAWSPFHGGGIQANPAQKPVLQPVCHSRLAVFCCEKTCPVLEGSLFWLPSSSGWGLCLYLIIQSTWVVLIILLGWFPVHCSSVQSFELVCTDGTDSSRSL